MKNFMKDVAYVRTLKGSSMEDLTEARESIASEQKMIQEQIDDLRTVWNYLEGIQRGVDELIEDQREVDKFFDEIFEKEDEA